jgi:methylated-DNA-[protein]-cysteine S-methyltransferase
MNAVSAAPFRTTLETPFGPMQIAVDGDGALVDLSLPNRGPFLASNDAFPPAARAGTREAQVQLNEYFEGKRRAFELRLAPRGSPFERNVWDRLCAIPYGVTTSYRAIATELGLANGARAVGHANGANPIAIVIPCHRVIGMDGKLTGYGGGLPLKLALLELEGALAPENPRLF